MINVFDIIFPHKCVICGLQNIHHGEYICKSCLDSKLMIKIMPKYPNVPFIDEQISSAFYLGEVRKAIHDFKFNGKIGHFRGFAYLMHRTYLANNCDYDVITWVPSNFFRIFKRGYSQTYLLAKRLGENLNIPVVSTLKKARSTKAMYNLTPSQRRANVSGAFACKKSVLELNDKRVLLVDDIFTTGTTVSECGRVLRTNGIRNVGCITLAHKKIK